MKLNRLKRIVALALASVMVLGTVACGDKKNEEKKPDKSQTQTEIPDLEGYTFTIMSPWMSSNPKEAIIEQEQRFWDRVAEIEEEYGCTIKVVKDMTDLDNLRAKIMSGSKVADIIHMVSNNVPAYAAAGYITPWSEIEGIDVEDDRWVKGYTKLGTIEDDVYGLNWFRAPEARMCLIVNKSLLQNSGVTDDIYKMVEDKTWNWEQMRSIAKQVVKVNTSNGKTSKWGVGGWYIRIAQALWVSNGGELVHYKNGVPSAGFGDNNMIEALNFMNDLVNVDKVFNATNYRDSKSFNAGDIGDGRNAFLEGNLAMLFEDTWFVNQYLKPSNPNFEYGIVPVPMGPQESEYRTDAGRAGVFVCSSTNANSETIDKTVAIINLLSEPKEGEEDESWWEYDLKKEYFQDASADKDLEMYKICLNTAVCDYGNTLSTLYKAMDQNVIQKSIFFNDGTPTSNIQSLGTSFDKAIESMFTIKKNK